MAAAPQKTRRGAVGGQRHPVADLSLVLLIILMVLSPMIMQSMIKVHATQATAVKSLAD